MTTADVRVSFRVVSEWFQPSYTPAYATEGAAGMDLHAAIPSPIQVAPGARVRVPTGIAIQLPERNLVALVYARSGLAWRHGLALSNGVGVIDSDYTGEVQVLLTNFGDAEVVIQPGDRIAQLVVAPIFVAQWVQTDEFHSTRRGVNGFGSTGVQTT
ncbi:deoxyuridine 5'-triphosphate nucleotidohydrolase [Alicyclobacillus acidoterrestris]|uniref:dUTP diphosphatase n=1 Tax=Alicyclobacillus suci TaxID=2816080 RepID=UPI00119135E9|nr:dUTP diphosphatase [Alicyclobacillus suci]GEO24863.1 deoxyuridine 5'-triphosphate nucleotidohydrolase [Alicyclobacillus acidoterrestris]